MYAWKQSHLSDGCFVRDEMVFVSCLAAAISLNNCQVMLPKHLRVVFENCIRVLEGQQIHGQYQPPTS